LPPHCPLQQAFVELYSHWPESNHLTVVRYHSVVPGF